MKNRYSTLQQFSNLSLQPISKVWLSYRKGEEFAKALIDHYMRNVFLIGFTTIGLVACTFSGTYLEPSAPGVTSEDIDRDINACKSEASWERELTPEERQLVEGKNTAAFFHTGRTVVTPDGRPALWQGLVNQYSSEFGDRYAVCLLNRGYSWEQK